MARAKATKLVAVRITEGTTVYVDGESYSAGATVQLPAADAKTLLQAGHADDGSRKSVREIKAAIRDLSDAELQRLFRDDDRRSVQVAADAEWRRRGHEELKRDPEDLADDELEMSELE